MKRAASAALSYQPRPPKLPFSKPSLTRTVCAGVEPGRAMMTSAISKPVSPAPPPVRLIDPIVVVTVLASVV